MTCKIKSLCIILIFCFSLFKSFGQVDRPKVIAYYYGNPATLDSFDVRKLDEIIYCFGRLQGNRFHMKSARDTAIVQKMVALKSINPSLKVVLSLGGWGGCETCSDVFASRKNSKEFAREFKSLTDYFKTDGIDLSSFEARSDRYSC